MFDIGFQELVVIFVVALIVFGPKRLPEIAKTLGRGLGELKRAMENVREQIHQEVKDIKPDIDPIELKDKIYSTLDDTPKREDPQKPEQTQDSKTKHTEGEKSP